MLISGDWAALHYRETYIGTETGKKDARDVMKFIRFEERPDDGIRILKKLSMRLLSRLELSNIKQKKEKALFWDSIAPLYDIFANVYNRRVHKELCFRVADLLSLEDIVLECACGTGLLTLPMARKCKHLTATDFSEKMLREAGKKCKNLTNITLEATEITDLNYPDGYFDKVVAGNVIHLLEEPLKALYELNRVCKPDGKLIIPTYMNRKDSGKTNIFSSAVGKAGADFKRQFSFPGYQKFFEDAGFPTGSYLLIEGRVPCALAVLSKR